MDVGSISARSCIKFLVLRHVRSCALRWSPLPRPSPRRATWLTLPIIWLARFQTLKIIRNPRTPTCLASPRSRFCDSRNRFDSRRNNEKTKRTRSLALVPVAASVLSADIMRERMPNGISGMPDARSRRLVSHFFLSSFWFLSYFIFIYIFFFS